MAGLCCKQLTRLNILFAFYCKFPTSLAAREMGIPIRLGKCQHRGARPVGPTHNNKLYGTGHPMGALILIRSAFQSRGLVNSRSNGGMVNSLRNGGMVVWPESRLSYFNEVPSKVKTCIRRYGWETTLSSYS